MYKLREYYDDIKRAKSNGVKVISIGKSTLQRDIFLLFKGNMSGPQVLVHAGIHAREYITTPLVIKLMEEYEGNGGIWCIPSVNIDGFALATSGLSSVKDKALRDFLIKANGGSEDFSLWKANANAVDLNTNFNADWGRGKNNINYPASANYIGEYPLKEVENQVLAGITLKIQPKITLSYHTKGNIVYYGYKGRNPYIAETKSIANYINYDLRESTDSFGGYKDWFMATTPYLGLTIECGNDLLSHPLPFKELDELLSRHRGLFELVSELSWGIN